MDHKTNGGQNNTQSGGGGCKKPPCFKSADEYDYSGDSIPGKMKEDIDYIINGKDGNIFTRIGKVFSRDINADPDTAKEAGMDIAMAPLAFFRIGKYISNIGDAHKTKKVLQNAVGGKKVFRHIVGDNPDVMFKNDKIFFTPSKSSPFFGKKPFDTGLNVKDFFSRQ